MTDINKAIKHVASHLFCPICRTSLSGFLEEDAWGNRYCQRHAKEFPRCTCCQRLICDQLTNGGVAYKDKRLVCNLCRRTAIDTKLQAKPYIDAVAAWLFQQGFTFQNLALKIELVYTYEMPPTAYGGIGEPQGVILKSTQHGRSYVRKVNGVAILKGLSRQVMQGVAAHELGHAWLFLHGIDGLSLQMEEGFCNLLSHLYHGKFDTDEARFCKRVIEENPDTIYGDGFRAVQASVQVHGLSYVVGYLQNRRMLP